MESLSSSSSVGPMEDVVQALLDYLVTSLLPLKSSGHQVPSLAQQQSVAKHSSVNQVPSLAQQQSVAKRSQASVVSGPSGGCSTGIVRVLSRSGVASEVVWSPSGFSNGGNMKSLSYEGKWEYISLTGGKESWHNMGKDGVVKELRLELKAREEKTINRRRNSANKYAILDTFSMSKQYFFYLQAEVLTRSSKPLMDLITCVYRKKSKVEEKIHLFTIEVQGEAHSTRKKSNLNSDPTMFNCKSIRIIESNFNLKGVDHSLVKG
ncbi:hypothetical protein Vadar_027964 [Vaccinium darrowii]|uniref:Uncharacterized protein n=1 Tax=Vaccinium darrowii TaxID=229202 RepID=A0ACB7XV77_9ERIC|nr:hypothetical protein Vadar_027964 [Vaccinium darrowii]